jgi:hypothetical protein
MAGRSETRASVLSWGLAAAAEVVEGSEGRANLSRVRVCVDAHSRMAGVGLGQGGRAGRCPEPVGPPGYRARVVFLTPDVPRWTPTTEADIQQAIADGILEESHWWDAKRQLNPGPKFNKAFAADLAAFAIDGGSLLIGLHEDKETGHVLPGAAADGREHLHAASAVDDARVRPAAALLIRAGLSPEQRAAVTTLLAAVAGTDPGRVSATGRRGRLRASGEQARPLEAQRRRLMTTGWLTLTELAARRSEADVAATGGWVAAQRLDRALIALEAPNGTIGVPAFQVTDDGQPRRELRPLLEVLLGAGIGGWAAWTWLTSPTGLLSGGVPERLAVADPGRALRAATQFAADADA